MFMLLSCTSVALIGLLSIAVSNANRLYYDEVDTNGLNSTDWRCSCKENRRIRLVNCSYSYCLQIPTGYPHTTEYLIMRGNELNWIGALHTSLSDFRLLRYLDLSSCEIQVINSGSFSDMNRLQVLNLSKNPLLEKYPEDLFLPPTNLVQLYLTETATTCTFKLKLIRRLTKLEVLWFGSIQICEFPKFYRKFNGTLLPLFPNLKELNFEDNNLIKLYKRIHRGLDALETLVLSQNRLTTLSTGSFRRFKNLSRLTLDRNYLTPGMGALASKSLKDLSLNYVTPKNLVNKWAFAELPKLEKLSLERSPELFNIAFRFGRFPKLVVLNLRGTGVRSGMLGKLTASLPKLRYLDLNDNDIDILRKEMFPNLELEVLLLGNNWLKIVDAVSLPLKTWTHLQRVDFSNNLLLECDCSIVWFRSWLKDPKKKTTVDNLRNTNCSGRGNNRAISIYHLTEPTGEKCFSDESYLCLISVFVIQVLICLLTSISSMLYRFRWQIKYYHFQKMRQSKQAKGVADCRISLFDAFICYSDFDRSWIVNQLCPRLENGFNLRLCIRDRDWPVGQDIVDNVVESIESSRKTVLIASNAFAECHWRHFEMTMAQTKYSENDRDNLILVLLEEIADCNMNPRLQLQMQKKTYIEWTDNQIGQQLFWAQLQQALVKNSSSLMNSVPPEELFVSLESDA